MFRQWSLFLLGLAVSVQAMEKPAAWVADPENDVVVLTVKNGALVDSVSGNLPKTTGTTIEKDDEMGDVLVFDGSGKGSVQMNYAGDEDILKGRGVTLEAWVKSDEDLNGEFFLKNKFGSLGFKENRLQASWLNLPRRDVYVEPEMAKKRLNYYPLAIPFNGRLPMRKGRWNHIALVYDENAKIFRSWINGGIDRECEVLRDGRQYMTFGKGAVRIFHGLKNARAAGLRVRAGVHNPGAAPVMKHYLNQLPWQNKMVLTLDKIDPSLPLPLEVMVILERTKDLHTKTFLNHDTAHMEFPMPKIWSATRPLYIKVYAGGKEVYNAMARYNNTPVPGNGKVKINDDKSISYQGRKIFPVQLYGVTAEDLKQVAELGFTAAGARDLDCPFFSIPSRDMDMMQKWSKSAVENGLYLRFSVNWNEPNAFEYVNTYKKLPKMLFWYGADEPWRDWEGLAGNYNFIRAAGGEFPVMSVQCREQHMKDTAPTCDIVGCDPYPVPGVSLRAVADLTRDAAKASFGLKPVWTVLGCYEPKIPIPEELRCMTVIAIASGANGLGIYSWDERTKTNRDKYHAAKRPEVVEMLKNFVSELRSIEPVLVEPNLPAEISDRNAQPAIHAALKKAGGKTWLFLANDQRCPEKATLTLPDKNFTKAVPAREFGFKDALQFADGKAELTLPPLAAGVFELQ